MTSRRAREPSEMNLMRCTGCPRDARTEAGKDEAVVIYCNGEKCMRSSKACAQAVEWGFTNISYFRDGFPAWKAAGYPTE